MNNKLINKPKKHRYEYYISYRKKWRKKNGICSIVGSGVWSGSGSADPDPHQNEADPKHCYKQ